jgi:hypothetical protein
VSTPARRLSGWLTCLVAAGLVHAGGAGAAVVLNEVNCEATDWVEVVNTGGDAADVSGWLLTDDPLTSTRADHRYAFPSGTLVAAGDDLVVERGAGGFPFGISCGSDTIRLADAGGSPKDEVAVPTLSSGADTWGRYPNGTGSWAQTASSRGAPNAPSSAGGGPPPDLAGWLFDPEKVVRIDLSLPQSSIDALNADRTVYRDATFTLTTTAATYGPMAVGARLKGGSGSVRPLSGKAAFKLKFNHSVAAQRFVGLEKLTLNNMVQDASMLHEVLAYDVFRAAGIAAPRTGYAYVRVNGDDYGLYLNVETPDRVFLPRWFDSTRHLLEGAYGADATPASAGEFEVDEGSESDLGDLDALVAAVGDGAHDYSDRMAPVADLAQMARMWAVEKYAGHWDGYTGNSGFPNNYYVHSDAGGRFAMLPWGTDQTWVEHVPFDGPAGVMFERCLEDVECAALYRTALRDVRALVPGLDLDAKVTSTAALLRPYQEADPRREQSMGQIDAAVSELRSFLTARPGEVDAWLNPPTRPPAGPAPVVDDPPVGGALSAVVAAAPPARVLRVGPHSTRGGAITTRVSTPGAGRLGQRATIRHGRGIRTICTAGARRPGPAVVDLHCRLWTGARLLLRARPRRVTVRTWFVPAMRGPVARTSRSLTLR